MAVNGIEIEVGQKWKTRGDELVEVTYNRAFSNEYPHRVLSVEDHRGWTVNQDGYQSSVETPCNFDLLTLIEEPNHAAGDFMGVSVKGGIATEDRRDTSSALAIQVGGTHYKDFAIQPVEYIHANKLGFCEGNVVKYITRHAAKNGADDIRKVIHYCQLLLELQYGVKKEGESK